MRRKRRLLVIANRLPVRRLGRGKDVHWERSPGGLVTALEPVLQDHPGLWIGWDGSTGRAPEPFVHESLAIRPISLTGAAVDNFYHGFSNRTLWPLYHDAIRTPEFRRKWWDPYVEVNRRFARAAARLARSGDLIWVQDYQLQLVPGLLRALRPDLRIGFFLHIPFPPEELFAWLPWRTAILQNLLGADVVGFQTPASAQNFSRAARRWTAADGTDTELEFKGRRIEVGAFPISIDFADFERTGADPDVLSQAREIRRRLGSSRRVLLAVDRLDYTKGIDTRLHALEDLLRRGALSVDDTVLVQIAVPSRESVEEYRDMRTLVEQTVGRINGEYSEPGRVAVHYFRRSLSRAALAAYYRAADVMIVTPLRDGMNLVAKEFVATRADNSGVLVLSEFAGASSELRRAILVNPRDVDGFGAAIVQALRMPRDESRQRMAVLRMQVRRHDVYDWARTFLGALRG